MENTEPVEKYWTRRKIIALEQKGTVTVTISNIRLYERQFWYSEKMEDIRGDTVE